jgi:hypothetical protein
MDLVKDACVSDRFGEDGRTSGDAHKVVIDERRKTHWMARFVPSDSQSTDTYANEIGVKQGYATRRQRKIPIQFFKKSLQA